MLFGKKKKEVNNFDADFLFKEINAFSIERQPDGTTLIGYLLKDESWEWTMATTDEIHQKLVNKFREYKAGLEE
jgi:hypothetical protein